MPEPVATPMLNVSFCFFGEECVLYNQLSGDVHLLPALNARLLQLMLQGVENRKIIEYVMSVYAVDSEGACEFINAAHRGYSCLGLVDLLDVVPFADF